MAKVVTKTGDSGYTTLKGRRVPKTHISIVLLGQLDHINSMIGAYDNRPDLQDMLYRASSIAAGYEAKLDDLPAIEAEIAGYDLNQIYKKFVTPRSFLHVLRSTIRMAEISAWKAKQDNIARILNRLSDLYFIKAELGG